MEYCFVFGRDPELSYLELVSWLKSRNIGFKVKDSSDIAAVLSMDAIDFKAMLLDLGGTLKIAKKIGLEDELYLGGSTKIKFAISNYGADVNKIRSKVKKQMKDSRLKASEKHSRRDHNYLSPSEVLKHGLLEDGFEIVAYKNFVGRTLAVYNPKAIEKRDNERPCQRHKQMISIRLAKILINLAGAKQGDTILDPFCGYGILLQEAMLMNLDVIGVDKSQECVNAAMKNLKWTQKKFNVKNRFKVRQGDSRELSKHVKQADCVATEPHLGPLIKKLPTKEAAIKTIKQLTPLYDQVLRELKKVVRKKIVMIIPRFRLHTNKRITINFNELIEQAKLKKVSGPIIYTAPKSKMEREIWILSN